MCHCERGCAIYFPCCASSSSICPLPCSLTHQLNSQNQLTSTQLTHEPALARPKTQCQIPHVFSEIASVGVRQLLSKNLGMSISNLWARCFGRSSCMKINKSIVESVMASSSSSFLVSFLLTILVISLAFTAKHKHRARAHTHTRHTRHRASHPPIPPPQLT